jgi:hypothetical protein
MAGTDVPRYVEEVPMTSSANRHVAGVETVVANARELEAQAAAKLAGATIDRESAETSLGAAKSAHDAKPTKGNAEAETTAAAAVARAKRVEDAARLELADARRATEGAAAALEQAKREARIEDLVAVASIGYLATSIANPWARAIAAHAEFAKAVEEIAAAKRESESACSELRAHGQHVPTLGAHHALLPGLRELARRGVDILAQRGGDRTPIQIPVTPAAIAGLLSERSPRAVDGGKSFAATVEHLARFRTTLEADEAAETARRAWHNSEDPGAVKWREEVTERARTRGFAKGSA